MDLASAKAIGAGIAVIALSGVGVGIGYIFAALVYFICCFSMSRYATGVEKRLSTGDKR